MEPEFDIWRFLDGAADTVDHAKSASVPVVNPPHATMGIRREKPRGSYFGTEKSGVLPEVLAGAPASESYRELRRAGSTGEA